MIQLITLVHLHSTSETGHEVNEPLRSRFSKRIYPEFPDYLFFRENFDIKNTGISFIRQLHLGVEQREGKVSLQHLLISIAKVCNLPDLSHRCTHGRLSHPGSGSLGIQPFSCSLKGSEQNKQLRILVIVKRRKKIDIGHRKEMTNKRTPLSSKENVDVCPQDHRTFGSSENFKSIPNGFCSSNLNHQRSEPDRCFHPQEKQAATIATLSIHRCQNTNTNTPMESKEGHCAALMLRNVGVDVM